MNFKTAHPDTINYTMYDSIYRVSNPQPRMAMNADQYKVVNLLKNIIWGFFCFCLYL